MNTIQMISQKIESDQLKLQMGLSPDIDLDTLTLRAMWRQLCRESAWDGNHAVANAVRLACQTG
jgi:hypothetical protein